MTVVLHCVRCGTDWCSAAYHQIADHRCPDCEGLLSSPAEQPVLAALRPLRGVGWRPAAAGAVPPWPAGA